MGLACLAIFLAKSCQFGKFLAIFNLCAVPSWLFKHDGFAIGKDGDTAIDGENVCS